MFKRVLGAALILGIASPAVAATCGKRGDMVTSLEKKYLEQLQVGGLQEVEGDKSVVELWTSEKTGTFTILMTRSNGISCVLAVGTDVFFAEQKVAEGEGTPS
ncbi:hypothetical protein ACM25N_12005 [Roseovarius sp. C7]|uniref:hypothetical protein n=1 Tax=Roseovarius sp. C7 TaxID=3398643 RepID=UPI0039F71BD6